MNIESVILVIVFLAYSAVREYLVWKQVMRLEELTKAKDLHEYYRGNKSNTVHDTNRGKNGIAAEEPNLIELDESTPFTLPDDMKVQWDEGKSQTIKIYQ